MIKNILHRIFIWIGRKLYKHQGQFRDGGFSYKDITLFSNIDKWSHKYGMSKWEMGLTTPKQPKYAT